MNTEQATRVRYGRFCCGMNYYEDCEKNKT
jgi:hypothetical protein